ncbi:MAG TPA: FtsL-like putative cell division protein [Paludibacter sp.]|nr:FtsL-like putative cell division protein [Paludibacter sp.]
MSWITKLADAIKGSEDFSDIKSSTVREILNGDILTKKFFQKQYGVIIMLAVLMFMYVDNRFYCEKQLAREIELKKKIQDLKYESLTYSAELMVISRKSNVMKMVADRGLSIKETAAPPIVIDTLETK